MKDIIVICGPTGVGKTSLSIALAKELDGEIINADSTQVYQKMNIGTAKITEEEKEGITHHLIDTLTLNDEYSIYEFQTDARKAIDEIRKKNKTPIIVGGSGLYLSALLYDYKLSESSPKLDEDTFSKLTNEELYDSIHNRQPELALDKNNRQRLMRYYTKYVINKEEYKKESSESKLLYPVKFIGLKADRDTLYSRINQRVDEMIANSLSDEVRSLYKEFPNAKQLRSTIGYKEIIDYLDEVISLEDAINQIKQNSRRYAKRQHTWFNNKMDIHWFNVDFSRFDKTIEEVKQYVKGE